MSEAKVEGLSRQATPPRRFAPGDRVRYVTSRASPPKTQSVRYPILAVVPESRFASYRIKGDTEPYERVAGEPQLTALVE